MERKRVRVARLTEPTMHPIQDGMRGLMGHDVVRETCKDHAARKMQARIARGRREVPEQERNLLRAVVGVRLPECVRIDPKALYVVVILLAVARGVPRPRRPQDRTA